MDQKKLLQIIQKDLLELTELTEELKVKEEPSKLEIEIALSKSRLIVQEYELLKEQSEKPIPQPAQHKTPPVPELPQETLQPEIQPTEPEEKTPTVEEIPAPPTEPIINNIENNFQEEEKPIEQATDKSEENITEETPEEKVTEIKENKVDEKEPTETSDFEDDASDEEEEGVIIVGERFAKEKSLNDMLSESKTLDHKFATSPIDKIEKAIGLNERFQYIRELFEGNADLFKSTVQRLDEMQDIKDAVDYLSTNFKWKKSEASMKFVQLVKRRFIS